MRRYSLEPRTRKYVEGYEFYWMQLLNTGLDAAKTASKKAAGEFLGNKIAYAVTKPSDDKTMKTDENPIKVEEIIIPPEKIDKILNKLRKLL